MTLLERDSKAPSEWIGSLPVTSRYSYGIAGERFFRAIKDEGRILGSRCKKCERIYVPGAIFCERCLGKIEEWLDVGTKGIIHTFTFLYENYDGTQSEVPEIIAFVRIADGGLVHRLGEIAPENVIIGMEVEAVFKSPSKREGSILDIKFFRPTS